MSFQIFLKAVTSTTSCRPAGKRVPDSRSTTSCSSAGREFQTAGLANENALSLNFVLIRGVMYDNHIADGSPERDALSATDRTLSVM